MVKKTSSKVNAANSQDNSKSSCLCKEIETVFSYRLQDAFQRGLGDSEWPGELHRQSADASILLKNAGYSGASFGPQQSNYQPQQHQQSHQQQHQQHQQPLLHQSQTALMSGRSPSRDLCGGSTPVLKSHTPRESVQAFRSSVRCDAGGTGSSSSIMTGRSPSRERLVQSQILCLPPASSSRELMARDTRDAWDYYGPPGAGPSNCALNGVGGANGGAAGLTASLNHSSPAIGGPSTSSSVTPSKIIHNNHPTNVYGRTAATGSMAARQSPGASVLQQQHHQQVQANNQLQIQHHQSAKELRDNFQRNNNCGNGPVNFRDQRFSLLSPNSAGSKMSEGGVPIGPMGGNGSPLHAASPQRLFNSSQGLAAFKASPDQRGQPQQVHQLPGQSQQMMQQQTGAIQQLQYPYYNAKLESLTHRIPNLSFEGLGHQQQQSQSQSQTPSQSVANMVSRVESGSSSGPMAALMHVHNGFPSSPAASTATCPLSPVPSSAASSSPSSSSGAMPDNNKLEGSSSAHVGSAPGTEKTSEPASPESVTSPTVEGQTLDAAAANSTSAASPAPLVGAASGTSAESAAQATLTPGVDSHSEHNQLEATTVSYSAALDGSSQLPALLEVLYSGQKDTSTTTTSAATPTASEGPTEMKFTFSLHRSAHMASGEPSSERAGGDGADGSDDELKVQRSHNNPSVKSQQEEASKARKEAVGDGNNGPSPEASPFRLGVADPSSPSATEEREGHTCDQNEIRASLSVTAIDASLMAPGQLTPESTDCGSLSKSSSDGDPVGVVSRKRPPTKLKSRRRNILSFPHHISVDELRLIQRRQESYGGSSSDENRSSGHASMSDGHTSSSPPAETLPRHTHYRTCLNAVPEDDKISASASPQSQSHPPKTNNNRRVMAGKASRHRLAIKDDLSSQLEHATGLEDIKMAIEQLTLRSHGSRTSYSTSTYSSLSGSEGGEPMRRLIRHSSLETINTNVTVADEFVWVDSYNRLVELQQLPWSNHDVLRVIQNGRIKEHLERVSMETVPRLSYLLQRALVRIAREAQRLARPLAMCSKQEVCSALRIVLSPALADSCIKACLRAAAMFTVSGDMVRQSKSSRAALQLSVGRFHRWMCDVRLGKFIHDYAAVYLAAGLENLLEEIMMQCLPPDQDTLLTASVLEHAIANNGDLWGLLQPYAHLNAGRTATGALALPRWPSQAGAENGLRGSNSISSGDDHTRSAKTLEQSLLTTCVGSINELHELLQRVTQFHFRHSAPCPGATANSGKQPLTWASSALHALFYFMRCSQLEHAEHAQRAPIQELVYERPYIVLPPLIEWVRVASAHAEHRHSTVLDKDDVGQAARLLLPGVDCPIRAYGFEEILCPRRHMDDLECSRKLKIDLAFKMLSSARSDLIPHALQLLPSTKINTVSEHGLTPLMIAAIRGDETLAKVLLDAGADVDAETPPIGSIGAQNHPGAYPNPETQHWTALTYAAIQGHLNIAKLLLDRGANVEGGARLSEDKCTETPLQVAAGSGNLEMISLLLSHGARPFLSTLVRDTLCYSSSAQKGCYSAIAVAAAHGQRSVLHKLLANPLNGNSNAEVLSLEEILAEGASNVTSERRPARLQVSASAAGDSSRSNACPSNSEKLQVVKLNKGQIKALQEAMYHSAENAHLDITLDLRNLGVPWTLHCWMHTLATAHEHALENVIDQLLQDFLQVWGPDDYSTQFVDECLPLLFNIFRYSKNEGTTLLLADIFATCYGRESIKEIRDTTLHGGPRIDPKFVNNPELSDVQFRVEGRVFYAHKIILITASPRFKSMLNSKFCEGNPPIIQINDIRYDIFQMVMHYLYKGGCENLDVDQNDVLELMAAANFFQLDGLLRFCESRCSTLVDLDNIVSMYIHAKVYNAVQLLEYCQGFLLQNMVALLTYDDSVRRLIFGKKLHNHDVLAGLLLTLQARIKSRSQHKK